MNKQSLVEMEFDLECWINITINSSFHDLYRSLKYTVVSTKVHTWRFVFFYRIVKGWSNISKFCHFAYSPSKPLFWLFWGIVFCSRSIIKAQIASYKSLYWNWNKNANHDLFVQYALMQPPYLCRPEAPIHPAPKLYFLNKELF